MSIPDSREEINSEIVSFDGEGHITNHAALKRLFWPVIVVLVALLSFGLGRLTSVSKRPEVKVTFDSSLDGVLEAPKVFPSSPQDEPLANTVNTATAVNSESVQVEERSGEVFASSKGKRYYYPGCKNTIAAKNKVTFPNKEIAESAGYTLAANCTPR